MDYTLTKDEEIVYSPTFKVYGYEWRLKIYPQGNAQAHRQNLSVFLELINVKLTQKQSPQALTSNTAKQYYFRLQLLNLNQAGKSVIKEYNSKFCVGECWGYAEFLRLGDVKDYLHDGKLLFVMGVKNLSYFDLCDNMKKYIAKLEGQTKILSELCENYYLAQNDNQSQDQNDNDNNTSAVDQLALNSSSSSLGEQLNQLQANIMIASLAQNMNPPHNHYLLNQDEISSVISSVQQD